MSVQLVSERVFDKTAQKQVLSLTLLKVHRCILSIDVRHVVVTKGNILKSGSYCGKSVHLWGHGCSKQLSMTYIRILSTNNGRWKNIALILNIGREKKR